MLSNKSQSQNAMKMNKGFIKFSVVDGGKGMSGLLGKCIPRIFLFKWAQVAMFSVSFSQAWDMPALPWYLGYFLIISSNEHDIINVANQENGISLWEVNYDKV